MLENIHIQNFRLFRDFKIENLARVNLIVGKNNVGKSSLLEAISLLVNDPTRTLDRLMKLADTRGEKSERDVYHLKYLFHDREVSSSKSISLKANGTDRLSLKIDPVPENNQLEIQSKSLQEPIVVKGVNSEGDYRTTFQRALPPLPEQPTVKMIPVSGIGFHEMARLWESIQLTEQEDDVIKMLKILDPRVQRIGFQFTDLNVMVKLEDQPPIPLGNMGDGMNRVLGIAIVLASAADGFLLVDEIDTGFHYKAITDMWRVVMETAVRLNVQVFATTHSWDCVESFAETLEMQEDSSVGALFRLEKREEEIAAVKYTAHDLSVATRQSIEVR